MHQQTSAASPYVTHYGTVAPREELSLSYAARRHQIARQQRRRVLVIVGIAVAALVVVLLVMPSHQFPTGIVTSVSRRYELLGWASRTAGRYIVEDDYDWEFRLAGKPIPSLGSIDTEGKVIYLSTFSKSLSPALRIAFGVFPPSLDDSLEHGLMLSSNIQ